MSSYLKIFGGDKHRVTSDFTIKDELRRSEGHYAACFSERRKPYKFQKNDLIYLARITKKPNDYVVFGKASVADNFVLARDKAQHSEIERLPWKNQWPYYLRLKNAQFIDGSLRCGIRIEDLIANCNFDSFANTNRWHLEGRQNINIRQVFCNQADVELTEISTNWIDRKFSDALIKYGSVDQDFINSLPRPVVEI